MDSVSQINQPLPPKPGTLVFVVDDEPMVGDLVQAILKLSGYKTTYFANAAQALEGIAAADPKPDVLLTDFQMPQMSGRELIFRARALAPGLKTILYSGNPTEETVTFYPNKPDGFLRKPFNPRALVDLVKTVMDG